MLLEAARAWGCWKGGWLVSYTPNSLTPYEEVDEQVSIGVERARKCGLHPFLREQEECSSGASEKEKPGGRFC